MPPNPAHRSSLHPVMHIAELGPREMRALSPKSYVPLDRPKALNLRLLGRHFRTGLFSRRSQTAVERGERVRLSQDSSRGKLPWHNEFLRKHGGSISTFADVGCALPLGAPTTLEARKALPKKTRVLAVDVVGDFKDPRLAKSGLELVDHSIVDAPLPEPADVIRFANVSFYLSPSERRRVLLNIHKSLNEGGLLLDDSHLYKKTSRGFSLVARSLTHHLGTNGTGEHYF